MQQRRVIICCVFPDHRKRPVVEVLAMQGNGVPVPFIIGKKHSFASQVHKHAWES